MQRDKNVHEGENIVVYEYVIEKEKCTTITNTYGQSRISIQLVHENFVGNDIYQEKTILFEGHKQFSSNKKGTNDQKSKKTPKTEKKKPKHDSHKRKKKNASQFYYPKYIQESLDHQIRFLKTKDQRAKLLSATTIRQKIYLVTCQIAYFQISKLMMPLRKLILHIKARHFRAI